MKSLEEGGIPCPHLTLGNILLGSKSVIQITDWEDILLGLTRLPTLHMPGDLTDRTSPYVLMAGVLLFEMANGEVPANLRRLMLACQGDLCVPEVSVQPEEEESEARLPCPINFEAIKLPKGLKEVLVQIFDPEEHMTVEEVLENPFFQVVKFKVRLMAFFLYFRI